MDVFDFTTTAVICIQIVDLKKKKNIEFIARLPSSYFILLRRTCIVLLRTNLQA